MSVLVLGLGNLVHSDDGLGVHAIQLLQTDPRVPSDVTLIDGGTQGLGLIPHISGFDRVLVIDAIDVGEAPGTLLRLEGRALDNLPGKASVHALGFADLMIALKLLDSSPEEVVLLGVQPQSTKDWSAELTPAVERALQKLPALVLEQIATWKDASRAASLKDANSSKETSYEC